jgi:hypothetical protein
MSENIKITQKIEAIPAEEFWSPHESQWDDSEELLVESERRYWKILDHTVLDVSKELVDLKKLPKEERRLRLASLKASLEYQKQGIALTIRDLYSRISENPDISFSELIGIVEARAPEYGFTDYQMSSFSRGIKGYIEGHEKVKKYREKYSDNAQLYQACFGRTSRGKVEVVAGPYTMHFRLEDSQDYLQAYAWYKSDEDIRQGTSDPTAGMALSRVKIPDLYDLVTIENTLAHVVDLERVSVPTEEKITNGTIKINLSDTKDGRIEISLGDQTQWEFETIIKDEFGFPARVRMTDPAGEVLFDAQVQKVDDPSSVLGYRYYLDDLKEPGVKKGNLGQMLRMPKSVDGYILFHLPDLLEVEGFSKELTLRYIKNELVPVINQQASEETRIHEEQHQLNKLFIPLELRFDTLETVTRIAAVPATFEETKQKLILALVRMERKIMNGIDQSARDEILASYRDGRTPAEIFEVISTSKLYDYASHRAKRIEGIPGLIAETLKRYMSLMTYHEEDENKYAVDAVPLEIDPQEVKPVIDRVFKEEYQKDLFQWVDAIKVLEQKGYNRDEIISLFFQEPVMSWQKLARRVKKKETQ